MSDQLKQAEAPSEREDFEAWAASKSMPLSSHGDGFYTNVRTRNAWGGWQARAALSTQQAGFTKADMNAEYARGRADGWGAVADRFSEGVQP